MIFLKNLRYPLLHKETNSNVCKGLINIVTKNELRIAIACTPCACFHFAHVFPAKKLFAVKSFLLYSG